MNLFSFKKGLLLLLLCAIAHSSRAASQNYDFKAGGIYYHITSTDESAPTVEVTYLYKNDSSNSSAYSGTISIPETVADDAEAEQSDGAATNTTYSVTAIGEYAFYECAELTSIVIPSSVTSIGTYAFYTCTGLTSIEIPNSVTSIGAYAFKDCESLATLTFAENSQLTSIGNYAFDGIAITSLVIPKSVTSLGDYAFAACSSLTTVTFEEGTQIASIGKHVFDKTGITSVVIPSSVTSLELAAFANCASLTSVTFEEGSQLTTIGQNAFVYCTALTEITLPNSVTTIGIGAFSDCTSLATVNLGTSVETITYTAFGDCTSLDEIIVLNTTPPTCTSMGKYAAFDYDDMSTIWLVVPEDYAAVYAEADTWSDFANLREYTVTTNITTTCDEGSYATRYSPYSYTLEEGLTAYFISGVSSDNALELTNKIEAGEEVPGDCGVLLAGTYETEYVNYTTKTTTYTDKNFDNDSNWLYGTIESGVDTFVPDYANSGEKKDSSDYTFFKLTYGNDDTPNADVLGFYWGEEEGAPFASTPKKAWLAIPNSAMPASGKLTGLTFKSGDEETTGITAVTTEGAAKDNAIYNLQGIRVNDMNRKGIYVVGGKKIIKK
ncbi:MAG: leucine-rich repeat domain-containing protein [Prevotella sp.]|nr:leucine-rich repeat domain-containing protein [Prevotella sp.]